MSTLVMKFGGTSTGNVDALEQAADFVIAHINQWDHVVVVVSAMNGVTDMLIACAELSRSSDSTARKLKIDQLHNTLKKVILLLFNGDQYCHPLLAIVDERIGELTDICQRIQLKGKIIPQELDEVAALGERINVHIFSALLRKRGIPSQALEATKLIVTDRCFNSAPPIQPETEGRVKNVLTPLFAKNVIPLVTGFIGATIDGITTTLGRGGSDFTAAIFGQNQNADEIWIWTDVDGIMSADPKLTSKAQLIPEITYQEVFNLSYFGAKVLHPKTILPASEANIPIWVINTFNPGCSGTRISNYPKSAFVSLSAITGYLNKSLLTIHLKPGRNLLKTKVQIHEVLKKRNINAFV